MKKFLPIALLATLAFPAKAQTYAPITLSGFTADVIANGAGPAANSTTADVDGSAYTFVSQNYVGPAGQIPSTFLPANGTISSAATATPGLKFQLADYTGNNSLRLTNTTNSGTLTFTNPRTADQIYLIATTAYPSTFSATVNFTDGTNQAFAGNALNNWFDGAGTIAIQGIGRVHRGNNSVENYTNNPRLYQLLLSLNAANITKPIQSIAFTKTSTGSNEILHIMGATIRTTASALPNDVGITAITTPNSGCSLTSQEPITVTLTNFGNAAQSNIPVSYTINGGTQVNEILSGSLAANTTTNYTFTTKANLSGVGSYSLVASANLPGDAQASNNATNKTVTMATAPASPTLTVSGATTFCPGSSVSLTAVTSVTGASFQWFKNGTAITGATSATYSANSAGNYTAVVNANGCSSVASAAITLNTTTSPGTPSVSTNGATTICSGSSITLTATSGTTGATYFWLKNGSTIPGANAATYIATTAGSYSAMAISGGCSSGVSSAISLTVNTTPATPTISQSGAILTSNSGIGNQWYLNNTAISGAIGQTYIAPANGIYTVKVTNNGCTSASSNAVNMTVSSLEEEKAAYGILIYPNPTQGQFQVKLNGVQKNSSIEIFSITGQLIAYYPVNANGNESVTPVSLQNMAAGTYLLKVTSDKTVNIERLIIK